MKDYIRSNKEVQYTPSTISCVDFDYDIGKTFDIYGSYDIKKGEWDREKDKPEMGHTSQTDYQEISRRPQDYVTPGLEERKQDEEKDRIEDLEDKIRREIGDITKIDINIPEAVKKPNYGKT